MKIVDIDSLFDEYIKEFTYKSIGVLKPEEIEDNVFLKAMGPGTYIETMADTMSDLTFVDVFKDYIYEDVQRAYKSFSIALRSNPHANLELKIKKSVHRLQIESEIESDYPV